MGFYEDIAVEYDQMIRFQERIHGETSMLKAWITRYQMHSAVDAACGTGLHAVILAQLGVRSVGADMSEAMLEQARRHAQESGVVISWVHAPMQEIRRHVEGAYDAVFCLGNSLPHLLRQSELHAAINNFFHLLNPSGILVIQMLNYTRILSDQERIVGIHRHGNTEFIRFYDFRPDMLHFNLLTVRWNGDRATHSLHTTPLYPYQKHDIEDVLACNGFSEYEWYGNMNFEPFDEQSSSNLVAVGKKSH